MITKSLRQLWMLVAVLTISFFFVSCDSEDNPIDAE